MRDMLLLAGLAFGLGINSAQSQEQLPEPVAKVAIDHHLATRLSQECGDVLIDRTAARNILKAVLAKQKSMKPSENGFSALQKRVGRGLLYAAETVYFEQMDVFQFDRKSACLAAVKAIKDEQDVGRYLKVRPECKKNMTACFSS